MVSPLQTWQHPEHKRLWIALGGLSVLVHIGILGLSLPYLLTLMTTGGSRSGAVAPPIELVLVDEANLEIDDAVRPEVTPANGTTTVSEPASPPEAAPPPAQDPPASAVSVPAEDSPPESPTEADSDISRETSSPRRQPATQTNPSPPAESPSQAETADTDPPPTEPSPPTQAETQNEEPADELPILDGTAALPDPSEGTAGGESTQTSFAVSIVSHGPPPAEQQYDLKDTFPSVPEGGGAAVPLQRQADCGWFNFFPQQWTYRVAVNTDGSIGQMTLLSETGDVREGEAIACLIERSSLVLIPAEQGGTAVYDDNLILTLVITRQ